MEHLNKMKNVNNKPATFQEQVLEISFLLGDQSGMFYHMDQVLVSKFALAHSLFLAILPASEAE
jgi:hypothetical protein